MMNPTMPSLPETIGRSVLVGFNQIFGWGWSMFMTAPKQNLAFGALGIAMAVSASNALFWQSGVHPAPLFAEPKNLAMNIQDAGSINPEIVPPHPLELAVSRAGELRTVAQEKPTVPAVQPTIARGEIPDTVNNEMLARAQEVLKSMGLFPGKVDGFYGPMTAQAIRTFEQKNGFPAKGAMTPEIVNRIINAPDVPRTQPLTPSAPAVSLPSSGTVTSDGVPIPTNGPSQTQPSSVILDNIISSIPRSPAEASAPMPPAIAPPVSPPANVAQVSVAPKPIAVAPVVSAPTNPQIDAALIEKIQFGLAKLGFYNSSLDGIAGESTAKAIREFENFLSYPLTGNVNANVLLWLQEAGAYV